MESILDDMELPLSLLELIIVLRLSGRLFLFLEDKCWGIYKWNVTEKEKNIYIHTYRERKKEYVKNVKKLLNLIEGYMWHYIILLIFFVWEKYPKLTILHSI